MAPRLPSARLPSAPGPEPIPGVGTVFHLIRYGRDPIGVTDRLFREYGPIVSLVRGPVRIFSPAGCAMVFATGAGVNRQILTEHDRYHMCALPGALYPSDEVLAEAAAADKRWRATPERLQPIRRTLTGLFHVNGAEHRRHRRLLMPAFHKTRIDAYRDEMVALTTKVLDEWRDDQVRDVLEDMTELTLRIATKTLFGEDAGEQGVRLARMFQEWLVTKFSPAMLLRFDAGPTVFRRWLDLTRDIDQCTLDIVRAKVARSKSQRDVAPDMLSSLIAARDEDGSALDEDELVGHAGVIFAAGHETSTNALAWTLLLLSQHPDIATDLVDELRGVLRGEAPTVEQLGSLPLLDAVVKESLRILPPVPIHPRLVAKDSELEGHSLPAGTELFLSIYHMHHDPDVFPRPQRFDPSRWSKIKPTVYEYNPFSAGPRMCIGASFATMEIKIVLAMLLQRFRIELLPGARVDRRVTITMAPKNGLPMRIRRADDAWGGGPRDLRGNLRELVDFS
ncbi:cytochrome P450 [Labilithrix luteola]|uniref:cytochrome P450 n=1 Tax=Labilithrix luteola TaxID=1391654 RepID=UPI0011BA583A|nr:cytochrome P450 [Labilithrix luteola]